MHFSTFQPDFLCFWSSVESSTVAQKVNNGVITHSCTLTLDFSLHLFVYYLHCAPCPDRLNTAPRTLNILTIFITAVTGTSSCLVMVLQALPLTCLSTVIPNRRVTVVLHLKRLNDWLQDYREHLVWNIKSQIFVSFISFLVLSLKFFQRKVWVLLLWKATNKFKLLFKYSGKISYLRYFQESVFPWWKFTLIQDLRSEHNPCLWM